MILYINTPALVALHSLPTARYFDYLFYIDFEASMADPRAQYALGHLQEFARFIRVLGCYHMDTDL